MLHRNAKSLRSVSCRGSSRGRSQRKCRKRRRVLGLSILRTSNARSCRRWNPPHFLSLTSRSWSRRWVTLRTSSTKSIRNISTATTLLVPKDLTPWAHWGNMNEWVTDFNYFFLRIKYYWTIIRLSTPRLSCPLKIRFMIRSGSVVYTPAHSLSQSTTAPLSIRNSGAY